MFPRAFAPQNYPPQNLPPQKQLTPRKTTPGKTTPDTKKDEPEVSGLNKGDLADLGNDNSDIRGAAFKRLTSRLPDELPYPQAKIIANYLLPSDWEPTEDELASITRQLPTLARYPYLLEALADEIANGEKERKQEKVTAVVGGLLNQKLPAEQNADWRAACRALLLERACELHRAQQRSGPAAGSDADMAADYLRELYKAQARAFGLDETDFPEHAQPSLVLEALIRHVAIAVAKQKLDSKDKAYLEQMDRRLKALRFVAENDLELTVLLQRIWIKVLVLALPERKPSAKSKLETVERDLNKKDPQAGNLLDQLRLGEENILRIWSLANDLKLP
jgi:hypothetical protein